MKINFVDSSGNRLDTFLYNHYPSVVVKERGIKDRSPEPESELIKFFFFLIKFFVYVET